MSQLQGSAGKQQIDVLCLLVFGSPGLPPCFQLSLRGSLHCFIVEEVADTLRQTEICAGMQQWEVLCLLILWQV
jgi:hypothetical protein